MYKTLSIALFTLFIFSSCKKASDSAATDTHGTMDINLNGKNYHLTAAAALKDQGGITGLIGNSGLNGGAFSFVFTGQAGTYKFSDNPAPGGVLVEVSNTDNFIYSSGYIDCNVDNIITDGTLTITNWPAIGQHINGSFSGKLAQGANDCNPPLVPFSGTFSAIRTN